MLYTFSTENSSYKRKIKKVPIVATNVGMIGLHDIKTPIVNPQIILTSISVSDLIFNICVLQT